MSDEDEEYDEYNELEKEFYKMFSLQERKILIEDIEKFHTKYIVEIVNGMLG